MVDTYVSVCISAFFQVHRRLATSFNLLVGSAGLFALAHAAFYAGGAYTTAILTTHYGWAFPWPIFAGVMLTACVGGLVALPALRIGGHYLVIVSLALTFWVMIFTWINHHAVQAQKATAAASQA